jgi:hypothetical protein
MICEKNFCSIEKVCIFAALNQLTEYFETLDMKI